MPSSATLEPRIWFFGGKGGAGKTTCASAFALACSELHGSVLPVLALSLDPAHSLADVLHPDSATPNLELRELDAKAAFADFMRRHREELRTVADRGTYFDDEDIEGFLDLSLPGLDEIMGLLELGELARDDSYGRVIVDLPPTGHALRLFDVSAAFDQLVAALELMQDKHRFAVSSLTRRYSRDAIDAFLEDLRESCAAAREALTAPEMSAFVLVARPELMVLAETARYAGRLQAAGVEPTALVVNMAPPRTVELPRELHNVPVVSIPRLERPPIGREALAPVAEALASLLGPATPRKRPRHRQPDESLGDSSLDAQNDRGSLAALLEDPRRLTIFGGKGGVGKTTMASATAIGLAQRNGDRSVVVLSIDPAHSLGDSLGQELGDEPRQVDGLANLQAIELEPARHWQQFKADWEAEGEQLLAGMPGGGRFDPVYDREIAEQLGNIQPTGLDELQAALCVIDLLDEDERRLVVVDSAPTGHLLRFLESPRVVVDWAKELMHILLKYGLAARVKRISEDLLELSRKTKRLEALLHDPSLCEVVVVTLDEPPVIAETERLLERLAQQRIAVRRVVVNQVRAPLSRDFEGLDVVQIGWRSSPIQGLKALEELAA